MTLSETAYRMLRRVRLPYPLAIGFWYFGHLSEQARISHTTKALGITNLMYVDDNVWISGNVTIGEYTGIGRGCIISSGPNSKVVIGKRCALGLNILIRSVTHITANKNLFRESDILIGNDVWIGNNVVITPGHRIGNNVIIGANSVVTHDIPDGWIVGGVPARRIIEDNKV